MPSLSVCCLAKNEENFLPSMVESVKGLASEVLILDTGSTDGTISVAKELGCRVESFEWIDSFAAARNHLVERAKYDNILMLDADETLLPESRPVLEQQVMQGLRFHSCSILNTVQVLGINVSVPLPSVRLFKRAPGLKYSGFVQESLDDWLRKMTQVATTAPIFIRHAGFIDGRPGRRLRLRPMFESELQRNPVNAWLRTHLALSYFMTHDYARAEEYISLALSSQDRGLSQDARSILMSISAEMLRLQGKYMNARTQAQRANLLMSGNVLSDMVAATIDMEQGTFDAAERKYMQLDVNLYNTRYFWLDKGMLYCALIKSLIKSGKTEKARHYAELFFEYPNYEGAMIGAALCEKLGAVDTAYELYKIALPLAPDQDQVRARMSRIRA